MCVRPQRLLQPARSAKTRLALGVGVRPAGEEDFDDFQVTLVCRRVQGRPVLLRGRQGEAVSCAVTPKWATHRRRSTHPRGGRHIRIVLDHGLDHLQVALVRRQVQGSAPVLLSVRHSTRAASAKRGAVARRYTACASAGQHPHKQTGRPSFPSHEGRRGRGCRPSPPAPSAPSPPWPYSCLHCTHVFPHCGARALSVAERSAPAAMSASTTSPWPWYAAHRIGDCCHCGRGRAPGTGEWDGVACRGAKAGRQAHGESRALQSVPTTVSAANQVDSLPTARAPRHPPLRRLSCLPSGRVRL